MKDDLLYIAQLKTPIIQNFILYYSIMKLYPCCQMRLFRFKRIFLIEHVDILFLFEVRPITFKKEGSACPRALYHGFGIRGYRYTRSYFAEGKIVFSIEKDPTTLRCPCCKDWHQQSRRDPALVPQTLPVGRKPVYIVLSVPRVAWLSTVPLEGTNNKIKTLQKQASGFRDMEFFKLKIYALNETKYALAG